MSSLVKNSLLYTISTLSIKASAFILLPIYSYVIPPNQYGYVYVVTAMVNFLSLLMNISMHGAVSRFYWECKNEDDVKTFYTRIVLNVSVISTIITTFLLVFRTVFSTLLNIPSNFYIYGVLTSCINAFYPLILSLLYMREEAVKVSITTTILGVLGIVIQIVMVYVSVDKGLALVKTLFINGIISFVIFLIYSKPFLRRLRFRFKDCVLYYKYSLSQCPCDMSVWFVHFSDRIFINRFLGPFETGVYGVGNTLGQIPQILFHSVNKAYVPYVFSSYKEKENGNVNKYEEMIRSTTFIIGVLAIIVTIMASVSNNIISIFAEKYSNAAYVMPLILFATLIDCLRIIFMNPIEYDLAYMKIKTMVWIMATILNVVLNVVLIPKYFVYGACISLLVSYSTTLFVLLYYSNKSMSIEYEWRKIIIILLLSVLTAHIFFLGNSFYALPLKLFILIIYVYIILRILNIKKTLLWQNFLLQIKKKHLQK